VPLQGQHGARVVARLARRSLCRRCLARS
jgi:hypothetical protein